MSKKSQDEAPILDAIKRYLDDGTLPFSVPGHKLGRGIASEVLALLGASTFRHDMPELGGFEDRRESQAVRKRAESLAAAAWRADKTRFSINGSSLSAHVAVLTLAGPDDEILVVRNSHKSMVAALILAGVRPVWLQPEIDADWDLEHGVDPARLDAALTAHPKAKGVFIVSPDYWGVTSDVRALAAVCHRHGVPLVVDEAWGPHLAFHAELPESAMHAGADFSFGSLHKTMNGLTQASILNVAGERVDPIRFEQAFDLFETTSPSSLILGSIDGARRQHALRGAELWGRTLALGRRAREQIARLPRLRVLGRESIRKPGAHDLDETKLLVDVAGLNVTGFSASDYLSQERKLAVEMADDRHLLALVSPADDDSSVDQLVAGFHALVQWAGDGKGKRPLPHPGVGELINAPAMPPRRAFFAPFEEVPLRDAVGRIATELVTPYPPGIARIVPGDRIGARVVEWLEAMMEMTMFMQHAMDPKLKKLRVVHER